MSQQPGQKKEPPVGRGGSERRPSHSDGGGDLLTSRGGPGPESHPASIPTLTLRRMTPPISVGRSRIPTTSNEATSRHSSARVRPSSPERLPGHRLGHLAGRRSGAKITDHGVQPTGQLIELFVAHPVAVELLLQLASADDDQAFGLTSGTTRQAPPTKISVASGSGDSSSSRTSARSTNVMGIILPPFVRPPTVKESRGPQRLTPPRLDRSPGRDRMACRS